MGRYGELCIATLTRPRIFTPEQPHPAPPQRRAQPTRAPTPRAPEILHALLAELMAPAADWGPVMLTLRNGMAELHATLEWAQGVAEGTDVWFMRGERHSAWMSERGIARIELVEPTEVDAAVVGLRWFDFQGQCMGRVWLPSLDGCDQARLWWGQHGRRRSDARRSRRTTATIPMMFVPNQGFTLVESLARGPKTAAWASAAMLQLGRAAELRLDLGGAGAAVRYTGPLGAALQTPAGLLATTPQCGLCLQPEKAVAAYRVVGRDGVCGLQLDDASGGRLLLQPQGAGASDWFAGVAERASELELEAMLRTALPILQPGP